MEAAPLMKEGWPLTPFDGIVVDEITNDNLQLLVVAQYGRNPDQLGQCYTNLCYV